MKGERDKISAKIRALLAKTVENGCTEDEAIAAAQVAAKLLEKYNLTVDEVELRENPFTTHTEKQRDDVGERLWKVAAAISELISVRYWISRAGVWPIAISFFGFDHEVEIAKYLLAICARAMRDEQKKAGAEYALFRPEVARRRTLPMLDGMADTLALRIRDLKPKVPPGTGLVALKNELIDAAMEVKTGKRKMSRSRDLEDEYERGIRAGNKVALNPAMPNENKPKTLLR